MDSSQVLLTSYMNNLVVDYDLSGQRPGVFRFDGLEGLQRVYDENLKDSDDIDIIMNRPLFRNFAGDYNKYFVDMRKRYSIHTRVITPDTEFINSADESDLRAVRYIPHEKFPFEIDLKITPKRVAITTLKEDIATGITILDPEIAINFKLIFELLWNIAEPSAAENSAEVASL